MILPNLLCLQREMVLMSRESSDVLQCLAMPFEIRLLFCTEDFILHFPLVKTMRRGLFSYLFEDLWSQNAYPLTCWPQAVHFSFFFLHHCFLPPPIAGATVLHVVPKPCSQLGSLFNLMKNPVISLCLAFSECFASPIHLCPFYLAFILLTLVFSRSPP